MPFHPGRSRDRDILTIESNVFHSHPNPGQAKSVQSANTDSFQTTHETYNHHLN